MSFRMKIYLIAVSIAGLVAIASAVVFFREFEMDKKAYLRDFILQSAANSDAKIELFHHSLIVEATQLIELSLKGLGAEANKQINGSGFLVALKFRHSGKDYFSAKKEFENLRDAVPAPSTAGDFNLLPVKHDHKIVGLAFSSVTDGDAKLPFFAVVDLNKFIPLISNDDFFDYAFFLGKDFIAGKLPEGKLLTKFLDSSENSSEITEFGDKLVYKYQLPTFQLTALATTEKALIYEPIRKFSYYLIGVTLVLLGFGIILTYSSLNLAFKPFDQLIRITQEIASGNFKFALPALPQDEVGKLGQALESMKKDLVYYIDKQVGAARIEEEVKLAQKIQANYCKDIDIESPFFSATGRYRACSETGGDYYNVFEVKDKTLVFFGDVSGHGLSSAMVTASIHGALLSKLNQDSYDAREIIFDLNEVLKKSSNNMMMTAMMIVFDHKNKIAHVSNASHLFPVVKSRSSDQWKVLSDLPKGPPLAFGEGKDAFKVKSYSFAELEELFIYCDGIVETPTQNGKPMGLKGLLAFLNSNTDHVLEKLLKALEGSAGPRTDDLSFLHFRLKGI